MSLRAMSLVLEHSRDDWTTGMRFVGLVIADHVNNDGQCWPSVNRISQRTGLSKRQVQRYILMLEMCGLLSREATYANGRQSTNVYHFQHDTRLWKTSLELWKTPGEGVTPTSPTHDTHVTLGGDTHVTPEGDTHVVQNM